MSREQADRIGEFWEGVWGQEGTYQPNHPPIKNWKAAVKRGREGELEVLDRDVAWEAAVKKQPSWKAPGSDMIHAYWYKAFGGLTAILRSLIWDVVDGSGAVPVWLIEGRTVMIEKDGCTGEPEGYRPITCLNIAYKALTGALAAMLTKHVEQTNLLPEEQKALRKGARGESE